MEPEFDESGEYTTEYLVTIAVQAMAKWDQGEEVDVDWWLQEESVPDLCFAVGEYVRERKQHYREMRALLESLCRPEEPPDIEAEQEEAERQAQWRLFFDRPAPKRQAPYKKQAKRFFFEGLGAVGAWPVSDVPPFITEEDAQLIAEAVHAIWAPGDHVTVDVNFWLEEMNADDLCHAIGEYILEGRPRHREMLDLGQRLCSYAYMERHMAPRLKGLGRATSVNTRLSDWRSVGDGYEASYPLWMRELRGQRGAYVIRHRSGQIVWVGHSNSDLYKTITRHFQHWQREARSAQTDWYEYPRSDTYDRGDVEVAIMLATDATPREVIYEWETALVCELQPEDNNHKQAWCGTDDVPF